MPGEEHVHASDADERHQAEKEEEVVKDLDDNWSTTVRLCDNFVVIVAVSVAVAVAVPVSVAVAVAVPVSVAVDVAVVFFLPARVFEFSWFSHVRQRIVN